MPWRKTLDPWAILVSEFMLQQTQVSRVIPRFTAWMERYPDVESLARAPRTEVLLAWSGLGYNRRAIALHEASSMIAESWSGIIRAEEGALRSLPGVGEYTARAVLAFAFDLPSVFLETNIRTALIKHYFPGSERVADRELEPLARAAMDPSSPRIWYSALMDYGAWLKRSEGNHGTRAAAYSPQSPFAGSMRRLRGSMLKKLLAQGRLELDDVSAFQPYSMDQIRDAASALASEGFAEYDGRILRTKDELI